VEDRNAWVEKVRGKRVTKRDEGRNMGKEGETEAKINQVTIDDN